MAIQASPAISVEGGQPGAKTEITPNASFTATIANTAGVQTVSWSLDRVDDTLTTTCITLAQSGTVGQTVSGVYPNFGGLANDGKGTAFILKSYINGGVNNATGKRDDNATTGYVKLWAGTAVSNLEVICVGEEFESNPTKGYAPIINYAIRKLDNVSASGGGGGGSATLSVVGWYDVTKYGAVGDGTTDDSAAVRNAHDAAYAFYNSTGRRPTVYFPPGKYFVECATSNSFGSANYQVGLTLASNVAIKGAGKFISQIHFSVSVFDKIAYGIGVKTLANVLIEDIGLVSRIHSFDSSGDFTNGAGHAMISNAVSDGPTTDWTIRNIYVDGMSGGFTTAINQDFGDAILKVEDSILCAQRAIIACWVGNPADPLYPILRNKTLYSQDNKLYSYLNDHGHYVHPAVSFSLKGNYSGPLIGNAPDFVYGNQYSTAGSWFHIQCSTAGSTADHTPPRFAILDGEIADNCHGGGLIETPDAAYKQRLDSVVTSTALGTSTNVLTLNGSYAGLSNTEFRYLAYLVSSIGSYVPGGQLTVTGFNRAGVSVTDIASITQSNGNEYLYGKTWFSSFTGASLTSQADTNGFVKVGNQDGPHVTVLINGCKVYGGAHGISLHGTPAVITGCTIESSKLMNQPAVEGIAAYGFPPQGPVIIDNCHIETTAAAIRTVPQERGNTYSNVGPWRVANSTLTVRSQIEATATIQHFHSSVTDGSIVNLEFDNCDFIGDGGATFGFVDYNTRFNDCSWQNYPGGTGWGQGIVPGGNFSTTLGSIEFNNCWASTGFYIMDFNGGGNWSVTGQLRVTDCDFNNPGGNFDLRTGQYGSGRLLGGVSSKTIQDNGEGSVSVLNLPGWSYDTVKVSAGAYSSLDNLTMGGLIEARMLNGVKVNLVSVDGNWRVSSKGNIAYESGTNIATNQLVQFVYDAVQNLWFKI